MIGGRLPPEIRQEKLERELAAARATLAEHVEENLILHRQCMEHEEKLAELRERVAKAVDLLEQRYGSEAALEALRG